MGEPRGESGNVTEHLDLLKWTICDESFFEKHKAPRLKPVEELVTVPIHPTHMSRTTKVGALLQDEQKVEVEKFLEKNIDVFA